MKFISSYIILHLCIFSKVTPIFPKAITYKGVYKEGKIFFSSLKESKRSSVWMHAIRGNEVLLYRTVLKIYLKCLCKCQVDSKGCKRNTNILLFACHEVMTQRGIMGEQNCSRPSSKIRLYLFRDRNRFKKTIYKFKK